VVGQGELDSALYRYGPTAGDADFRRAITEWLSRRGVLGEGDERDVLLGAGGTHALYCAARCVFDPGDDVLVCAPYWPLAPGVFHQAGARSVEVPLSSVLYADPSVDAGDVLRAACTPKTRALYVITPNNPDGKVLTWAQTQRIVEFATERDLWIFSDEVYDEITFDTPHVPVASIPGAAERTITLHSFSKSRALAGARVGFAVAPRALVTAAQRIGVHTIFNVPLAMQRAARAAIADAEWTGRARAIYRAARDASVRALEGAPVRFHVAEGGTYLFLDFADMLRGRLLSALLAHAIDCGVMLAPGEAFGQAFGTYARLCYTSVPEARVVEGIGRLRSAISRMS
jgi:aspartate/methionine/tyrosine aminotransferase